jgi:choline dehydrogenase-like flavoprotein
LSAKVVLTQALQQNNLSVLVGLEAEASRGSITVKSADPATAPVVNLNYLSEPSDLIRLRDSLKVALELLQSPSFKSIEARVVSPDPVGVSSDKELADWVRSNLNSAFHSFHSTHMGPDSDPMAVVDQHCRVHGTQGLRVADLSIVPSMRRGPAATAVMIGERVAALIDEQN